MPELKILGDSPTTEDRLGFGSYVDILLDAIRNFDAESSLTIGIHGSWGSGKTSLMRMLEKRFEADNAVKTVWFNAWAHEQEESIGLTLLYRVLTEFQKEEETKERIRKVLENTGKLLIDAGLRKTTGIPFKEAQKLLKNSIEIKSTLRDDFETAIAECLQNKRLVVFIDDLDRCLPEKTIEILEVIKLFLDVSKCVFVIGVAKEMIEQGFAVRYKTNGRLKDSGREYIEKIIQVPFTLPPIREMVMMKFIESLSMNETERKVAKLVAKVTHCNPRKVKVFLNIRRIRQEIAEKTGGLIEPEKSAKFFALEYIFPEFFDYVKSMYDKNENVIHTLERLVKGDHDEELNKQLESSEMLQKYYQNEDLKSLLRIEPFVGEIDIGPYIYLAGEMLAVEEVRPTEERMMEFLIDFMDLMVKHPEIFEKFKQYVGKDQASRL
jgi:Cdc6-like AAA superfamily ATPase